MGVVGKLQVKFRWDYRETINHLISFDALLYLVSWDYMFGDGEVSMKTGLFSREIQRELQLKDWREQRGCSR